jgi:hypothetical protein
MGVDEYYAVLILSDFFSMTATATQAWRESYLLWASGTTLTQTS